VFRGEKTSVFWIGLVILAVASVGLFTVLWYYAIYPSDYYLKSSVPIIAGTFVFILIGFYMIMSGVKKEAHAKSVRTSGNVDTPIAIENEKDYSDYIAYLSTLNTGYALFCGLLFTAITVLLTGLRDPTEPYAQAVLFFLAIIFDLFASLLQWNTIEILPFVKHIPPVRKRDIYFNVITMIAFVLWGFAIVAMFLLWSVLWPAILSGLFWGLALALSSYYILRTSPVRERLKRS